MKIVQLNVWMGKVEGNLQRFFETTDADVICMQEVMASFDEAEMHLSRMCFDLSRTLKAFGVFGEEHFYFSPNYGSKIANGHYQLGNLIVSKVPIVKRSSEFVNGEFDPELVLGEWPRNNLNIQAVELENGLTIINHHGYWRPSPIGDENTVAAFRNAARFVKKFVDGPLVMTGDLNVIHESPAMREFDFLRDLTDENKVETTLSGLKFDGKVPCDHILVNDKINVLEFKVLPDLVSDHLAVECEFEVKG